MPTPLPLTPGYDFSGVVESIIPLIGSPTEFIVGDEVFGCHSGGKAGHTDEFGYTAGAFAEYLVVPIRELCVKPKNVSHEHAASGAMVSLTATLAFEIGKVTADSRVLVQGGIFVSVATFDAGFDASAHQPRFAHAAFLCGESPPPRPLRENFIKLIAEGTLKLRIEDVYPLTQEGVTAMWTKMVEGKSLGKNVLKIV
eukprot:gene24792-31170_t